jgi:hypothetical protein
VNEGIELHDSELVAVSFNGDEAVVSVSPAYIHRSTGRPGVDAGSGWSQRATITIGGASPVSSTVLLPATISDGSLRIGGTLHRNVIPASATFEGIIEFSIVLSTAEAFTIPGQRISIQLHDEPSFVESFHP